MDKKADVFAKNVSFSLTQVQICHPCLTFTRRRRMSTNPSLCRKKKHSVHRGHLFTSRPPPLFLLWLRRTVKLHTQTTTQTQLPQPRIPPHSAASSVKTPPVVAESLTRMPPPSLPVSPPPPIFDVTPSLPLTHTTKSCEADSPDRLLWGRVHSGVSELERGRDGETPNIGGGGETEREGGGI